MANEEKQRYSAAELKEFEEIILGKLEESRSELNYLRETLSKKMTPARMTPLEIRR